MQSECSNLELKHLTMKLGTAIKTERLLKNFSQEYMADELNISQRAYSKIENNEIQLKIDRLIRICEILNISPTELINDNRSIEKLDTSSLKENSLYERIIENQRTEILFLKGIIQIMKP